MLYPSCIIVSHFGPSVWLPTMEVSLEFLSFINLRSPLTMNEALLGCFNLLSIRR
jgi:hypothetical protein